MSEDHARWLAFKRSMGLDHDYLAHYLEVRAVIVNEEALRIGRGKGEGFEGSDLPVVKDFNNVPYIPGSSLKGAFRSWLEALHSPLDTCRASDMSLECCSLKAEAIYKLVEWVKRELYRGFEIPTKALSERLSELYRALDQLKKRYERCPEADTIVERFEEAAKLALDVGKERVRLGELVERLQGHVEGYKLKPCVICRVFGNKALAAHVNISDARPLGNVITLVRTRVAIDRFTQAALPGALFDYEYVPAGYKWAFKLVGWNINLGDSGHDASQLLAALLRHLALHGVPAGGMKSVGHGLLKLVPEETVVKTCTVERGELRCEEKTLREVLGV